MPKLFRHATGLAAEHHVDAPATAEAPLDRPRNLTLQGTHHGQVIRGQTCPQGGAHSIGGWKRTAIGDGSGAAHSSSQGRKMTASNGQQQALALERLGRQCIGISQERGRPQRFKATLITQQRLVEIRTGCDEVMADASRKRMRSIHHPTEWAGLMQSCLDSANALQLSLIHI